MQARGRLTQLDRLRRITTGAAAALATLLAAPAARAACTVGDLANLPVTMTGLRPLVPAKINGTDELFIADSGAFFSLISPASASELHLKLQSLPPSFRISGVGGEANMSLTTVKTFRLLNTDIHDIDFLVGGSDTGAASVGLLGQNVLGMADVEYDLEHGAIRLMKPHGCERVNLAYWAGEKPFSVVRLNWAQGPTKFTVVTVSVNGVNVRALLDSGAALSGLSLDAARRAGIRPDGPGVKPAGISRGIGRNGVRTWIAPVQSFKIGDEEIKNTHLRIADLDLTSADMLLGADFLLSHRVFVSNSQSRMYFTYDGGPVFNLEMASAQAAPGPAPATPVPLPAGAIPDAPTDAEGYVRRGAAFAARREYASAVADYSKAIELAPDRADAFQGRALARMSMGQPFLAMGDLDSALKLQPTDIRAHVTRAGLRLRGRDRDGAMADVDAAAHDAAREADVRLRLAELYGAMDSFDPAIAQYDLWIASHGDDSRMGPALGGRCWARALAGRDLDRALPDCNRAVRLAPDAAAPRGARGMVELRRDDLPRAIADFDAALKTAPKGAWWLYGRGVAELKSGKEAEGRADLAAAAAADPKLADHAAKLGFPPLAAAGS